MGRPCLIRAPARGSRLVFERGLHERGDSLAVGLVLRLGQYLRHDLAHVARTGRARLGDDALHDRAYLGLPQLFWHVIAEDRELALLFCSQLFAPALAERLDGVAAHLRLLLDDVGDARIVDLAGLVRGEPGGALALG